ncbi:TetR family transcriptional regulator [Mycolicibacterium farcinogenes]|uniref:TetR family transcriptional regulator n=1 Tax=Mycolicibacterium farcinogenes TaxID=1802 RepID=UPI001C8D3E7B|nr:TetR family transcriptional regulator [Mycolicibacterium farcinogenes]QZH60426.1 TetR family transcriptional regulator [Mycolicibacterium farcinogenes]
MRSTAELRDEILAAARAEFARYGLAGARIDRIAKSAHASKERLYAHFGDKETLFREVFAADGAEFFRSVSLRPEAVPEFVGDIFDLACRRPEHLRMISWAQLEGFSLDEPQTDGPSPHAQAVTAIEAAQAAGLVDPRWNSTELIVLLFGIGLAWAHLPSREAVTDDPAILASRRAAAVEAAARVVAHQTKGNNR